MSSAPITITYSRNPDARLHFDDIRKNRHALRQSLDEQPFFSADVAHFSNDPNYIRVHNGMKWKLDLYKEKRKTFF